MVRSTPDAVKFIKAIGALKLHGVRREEAAEAERERLRTYSRNPTKPT